DRVLFMVAASRPCPMTNRKVTAAASQKLPMMMAPIAATETRRSILITLDAKARTALITMLYPATTAANSINALASGKLWPATLACSPAAHQHTGPITEAQDPT